MPPVMNPPKMDPPRAELRLSMICVFLVAIAASVPLLDMPIYALVQSQPMWLHLLMRSLSRLGDSSWSIPLSAVFAAAFAIIAGRLSGRHADAARIWRNKSLFVLSALVVSGLATMALKGVIGRARPGIAGINDNLAFSHFTHSSNWASFPSGHTTTAVALALSLGLIFPRARAGLLGIAALVGLSRIVLGVHWFSDTLAGGLVAYLVVGLLAAQFRPGFRGQPQNRFLLDGV